MVVALLATMLMSCTTSASAINVTLKITAGEEEIFNDVVELTDKEPTILMLFQEAAILNEIPYVLNDAGDSVKDIADYPDYTDEETNISYFWEYLINGVQPDNETGGKANAQIVNDGDVIEYIYSTFDPASIK